jgi:hypothetical protein
VLFFAVAGDTAGAVVQFMHMGVSNGNSSSSSGVGNAVVNQVTATASSSPTSSPSSLSSLPSTSTLLNLHSSGLMAMRAAKGVDGRLYCLAKELHSQRIGNYELSVGVCYSHI